MPVDIHAGSQERINAVLPHFCPEPVEQFLDQHAVPCAGKACARRNRERLRAVVHPDPAGPVRTARGRDAKILQPVRHSPEGSCCSGRHFRRVHAFSAGHRDQVLVAKLRQEGVHRRFPVSYIRKLISLISRIRDLFRHPLRPSLKRRDGAERRRLISHFIAGSSCRRGILPAAGSLSAAGSRPVVGNRSCSGRHRSHPVERPDRRQRFLAYLDHRCAVQRKASALFRIPDTASDMEGIRAFLQHPRGLVACHATVVITGDRPDRHLEFQVLVLPGVQHDRLSEGAEHSRRFPELPLRRLAVDLHDLLARRVPGIGDPGAESDRIVPYALHSLPADLKTRVGKPVSKGIQDLLLRKCLKIAIPHINVFRVNISFRVSEICVGRIITDLARNGIRKLPGRRHLACEDVKYAVPAFLSALPDAENCGRAVSCRPVHVDDIACVKKDDRPGKDRADPLQHRLLPLRQVPAPALGLVVPLFSGRSPDDHDRGFRFLRGPRGKVLRDLHLFLEPGLGEAVSFQDRMVREPLRIGPLDRRRERIRAALQDRLAHTGHVPGVDHAARSRAALVIMKLCAPEQSDTASREQRQLVVPVLEHDDAFRLRFAGGLRIQFFIHDPILHLSPSMWQGGQPPCHIAHNLI